MNKSFYLILIFSYFYLLPLKAENIDLSANKIIFNLKTGDLKASGDVKVKNRYKTLTTSNVNYNTKNQNLYTDEKIRIENKETGEVFQTKGFSSKNGLTDTELKKINITLGKGENETYLSADNAKNKAVKKDGKVINETLLENVTYTACKKEEGCDPTWHINSSKIKRIEATQDIVLYNSTLRLNNFPIFYTPFLTIPDPSVERRQGFLNPSFGTNSDIGFFLQIPYYYPISPSHDLTFTVMPTTEEGIVWLGEHRKHFGKMISISSFSYTDNETDGNSDRGHFFSYNNFNITDTIRGNINIEHSTDDDYLAYYSLADPLWLTKEINIERLVNQDYGYLKLQNFNDLRTSAIDSDSPKVLPEFSYTKVTKPNSLGIAGSYNINGASLKKNEDRYNRLSGSVEYSMPYLAKEGILYTTKLKAEADVYKIENYDGIESDESRIIPSLSLKAELPLYKSLKNSSQIITPSLELFTSTENNNTINIPNTDSSNYTFDDTNLFNGSLYSGEDIKEEGTKVNYGLSWKARGKSFGEISTFLGQSYRITKTDIYSDKSNLNSGFSDFVGKLYIYPNKNFKFTHNFRLNRNDLGYKKNNTSFYLQLLKFGINLNYLYLDENLDITNLETREEISGRLSYQFNKKWQTAFTHSYDLQDSSEINTGFKLNYKNDCFNFASSVIKDYIEDSVTLYFKFSFKTIGDFETSGIDLTELKTKLTEGNNETETTE